MLKTLLDSQSQAYHGALDVFMKQINDKFKAMDSTINDLLRSLEFTQSEVDNLKGDVRKYKQDNVEYQVVISSLKEEVKKGENQIRELQEKANYQEDFTRRNNLQIIGLEEKVGETWEQTTVQISQLLEQKLQLPNIQIEGAHRVGRRDDHRPRPVVAQFSRYADREAVLRNVTKLRGTKIFINEDLCPASQAVRKAQLPQLKQARSEGKVAFFRHTKLIIKERPSEASTSTSPRYSDSSSAGKQTRSEERGTSDVSGVIERSSAPGGPSVSASTDGERVVEVSAAGVWAPGGDASKRASLSGDGGPSGTPTEREQRRDTGTRQRATRASTRGGRKDQ